MDIIIFLFLTIGLPVVGYIICLVALERYSESAIDSFKMGVAKWEDKLPSIKLKLNIFRALPFTGVLFGTLIAVIYFISDPTLQSDIEDDVIYSVGMLIGFSSLFMCLGVAIFYKEAIPNVIEDVNTFARYILLSNISNTAVIYGLLSAILLLMGVGMLGGEPVNVQLTPEDGTRIFNATVIFSILCSSSILKGYLPTLVREKLRKYDQTKEDKDKNIPEHQRVDMTQALDYQPDPVFNKKMLYSVLPEAGLIVGLFIVILTYTEIGLLGAA
jgi:F0F1-type ATP synthase membrane subunit c/vacuolar-type H+-ATPase subunit K